MGERKPKLPAIMTPEDWARLPPVGGPRLTEYVRNAHLDWDVGELVHHPGDGMIRQGPPEDDPYRKDKP